MSKKKAPTTWFLGAILVAVVAAIAGFSTLQPGRRPESGAAKPMTELHSHGSEKAKVTLIEYGDYK